MMQKGGGADIECSARTSLGKNECLLPVPPPTTTKTTTTPPPPPLQAMTPHRDCERRRFQGGEKSLRVKEEGTTPLPFEFYSTTSVTEQHNAMRISNTFPPLYLGFSACSFAIRRHDV